MATRPKSKPIQVPTSSLGFVVAPSSQFSLPQLHSSRKLPYRQPKSFLQTSNFRFVCLEGVRAKGDWNAVVQVVVPTTSEISCPICLQSLTIPRCTSCGHIYCWTCILYFLYLELNPSRPCPICGSIIHLGDLKPVLLISIQEYHLSNNIHDRPISGFIRLQLASRQKNSHFVLPKAHRHNGNYSDHLLFPYSRVFWITVEEYLERVLCKEKELLLFHYEKEEKEKGIIEKCLNHLEKKIELIQFSTGKGPLNEKEKESSAEELLCGLNSYSAIPLRSPEMQNPSRLFFFYQSIDGQYYFLDSDLVRFLLNQYGDYQYFPDEICGILLCIKHQTMSLDLANKLKYLSHIPIGSALSFVTIDISEYLTGEVKEDFFRYKASKFKSNAKKSISSSSNSSKTSVSSD